MTTAKGEDVKRRDMLSVRPENLIIEENFNVRLDMGDIDSLAQSITESGLKTPLRVYRSEEDSSKFVVVNGHRRREAILKAIAKGASIEYVDVVVEPRKYSVEARTLDLILTNDGKSLRPIEEAIVFDRLKNYGWSHKQISEKSGRSLAQVYNLLDLSLAPQKIKNLIAADKISEGVVIAIMKSNKNPEEQIALVEEAVANAKAQAVATGGKEKKATAKHLKSSDKVKTPLQILTEVAVKLEEKEVKSKAVDIFLDLMAGAKSKKSVASLIKLFE